LSIKSKMGMTSQKKVLIALFLVVLGIRLFFAFQTSHFSSDQAYYEYRNIQHIVHTLKPIVYDTLSYGGRYVLNSHIFHYIMAIFYFITPYSLKIVPEILLASIVIIAFVIANLITRNETASLLSAALAGFVPAFMIKTLNQVSVYSIVIPLLFLSMYALLNIEQYKYLFIVLCFALPLVHPAGALFSASLVVYLIFASAESIKVNKMTKEASVLAVLTALLLNLLVLKKAFLSKGLSAIWQSMPNELISIYFRNVTALGVASDVGVLPLIFGTLGFALGLFRKRKNPTYLLGSVMLTVFLLLALKWVDYSAGVMLLGLLLSVMSAVAFDGLIKYLSMTKFSYHKKYFLFLLVVAIVIFSVWPSITAAQETIGHTLTDREVAALIWLKENTPVKSTVLADISEGHYVSFFAKRKNVGDTNFLMAPLSSYRDIEMLFRTQSLVKAMELIEKHSVDYVYLSKRTKENYNIKELVYTRDTSCFKKEFQNEQAEIYRVSC